VTLYQMATGRLPFQGDTAEQIMRAIIADAPFPARAVNAAVRPALEAILLKALEKGKAERYQSAADLNRDLTKLQSSLSRRRQWKLAAGIAFACAALAVALKSGFFTVVPRVPELALRQVTANHLEDPVFRGSISADGRYAAYSDLAGLHIRRIDTGETRSITPPEGLCFR
jgi:eukaryotic-like serine/threonine-protein kinase